MKKIAFFIGSDITSQLVAQDTIRLLNNNGVLSTIFLPKHISSNKQLPKDLIFLSRHERSILYNVIYPFLEKNLIKSSVLYNAPFFFKEIYDAEAIEVLDINDAKFKNYVFNNFTGVISIRCYHKFDHSYIEHFNKENRFIWNLHPGDLPKYRGVMTCIRAMNNGERTHCYSLHVMDGNWDSGHVIAKTHVDLDLEISMLENMCKLHPAGAFILNNCIARFHEDAFIKTREQKNHTYYTFPTEKDIAIYKNKGIRLYDSDFMKDFYLSKFLELGSTHRENLSELISTYLLEKA